MKVVLSALLFTASVCFGDVSYADIALDDDTTVIKIPTENISLSSGSNIELSGNLDLNNSDTLDVVESRVMLRSKIGELNFNSTPTDGLVNLDGVIHASIRDGADLVRADFKGTSGHYDSLARHPNGDPYITIRGQRTTVTEKEEEQAPSFNATNLGNNWYQHDRYGTFWQSNTEGWCYHLDHGWIYVDEWDDNGTWMYVPLEDTSETESDSTESVITKEVGLGWMWTKAEHYPHLYNNEVKDWMYFNKDRNHSKYYSQSIKSYIPKKINKIQIADDDTEKWKELLKKDFLSLDNDSIESALNKADDMLTSLAADDFNLTLEDDTSLTICFKAPLDEWDSLTLTAVEFPITDNVLLKAESGKINFNATAIDGYVNLYNTGHASIRDGANLVGSDFEGTIGHYNSIGFPVESRVMLRSKIGELNFNSTPIDGYVNLYNTGHASIRDGADLARANFDGTIGNYKSIATHPNGDPYITIKDQVTSR